MSLDGYLLSGPCILYRDQVFWYLGPYLVLVFDIEVKLPTNPEEEALTCTLIEKGKKAVAPLCEWNCTL